MEWIGRGVDKGVDMRGSMGGPEFVIPHTIVLISYSVLYCLKLEAFHLTFHLNMVIDSTKNPSKISLSWIPDSMYYSLIDENKIVVQ